MSVRRRFRDFGVLAVLLGHLAAPSARADDCCSLVKGSAGAPLIEVRVCEPDAEGGCGPLLFVGALEQGDAREVCSSSGTLVHQTYDAALGGYGELVSAECDGDVEL